MARKLIVEIVGDASSLDRAFRRSSASGKAFGHDMQGVGRGALVATAGFRGLGRSIAFASGAFLGGAGLAAGLKASIAGFSSFTEAMQRSVGLAGVAQDSVHGFSKEILNLSTVVGKSPQELAQGFYFIASSGIAASKAMDVLTVSAKASAAGLGETQTVADAVTSAINAYGAANLSAQQAADILVATVREGKGEAAAFAPVIGNVATLASQLGVSFGEVGAALAAQTRLGTDAETAATQLQRVFSSLIKVTPQSAKAFKSVGLNAATLRDELGKKGLLFVLEEVKKAFGDNLPALAKAFGDVRAVRGVLALIGNQAAATEQIFGRLKDTSGALKTAFDAVSKDTAQQFRRLRSSVQVAGIAIGAVFAPLAGAVADVLAKAADHVTKFFDEISQAHTVQAKLKVAITGAKDAAKGLEAALVTAVEKVDWQQVFAAARGIADGLQTRLEQIDWSKVGKTIGDGIAKGISGAAGFAKALGNRFEEAFRTIDFVKLGRAAGPGLAAAVLTAFATITDPSFWIKNWDLALAVALTAFGGVVGKVAGKLAAPLVRVLGPAFERSILAIAGVVGRGSERIGLALLDGLLKLPALVARALAPIQGAVERVFKRLGRIGTFIVKVLGIQAAINALVGFGAKVGAILKGAFSRAWEAVRLATLTAVEKVIALLARIPTQFKVLGHKIGFENPFKGLDQELKNEIAGLGKTAAQGGETVGNLFGGNFVTAVASSFGDLRVLINQAVTDALHGAAAVQQAANQFTAADANRAPSPTETPIPDTTTTRTKPRRPGITADKRNTFFDNAVGRLLDRVQDAPLKAQVDKLKGISALITARIAATKDVTRKLTLEDKLLAVARQIKGVREQLAQGFLDGLQLNVDKAGATTGLGDDLKALAVLRKAIERRISSEKDASKLTELENQLLSVSTEIANARKQISDDFVASLQRGYEKSQLTAGIKDDITALTALEKQLTLRVAAEKRVAGLGGRVPQVSQAAEKLFTLPGKTPGLLEPGNLDLLHRKIAMVGKDIATVRSITISVGKKSVLLPTIINGKALTGSFQQIAQKAIAIFKRTGKNLGTFASEATADAYAERLHLQQEKFYGAGKTAGKATAKGIGAGLTDLGLQLAQVKKDLADAIAFKRNARQFKALGLTATGEDIVPGIGALKRQLKAVDAGIEGSFLDTKKTRSLVAHLKRVLSGGLGEVGSVVRAKIKQMLDDLDSQLKGREGDVTKFRHVSTANLLKGLGLNADQLRIARLRLSTVGAGGTVPAGRQPAFAPVGSGATNYHIQNLHINRPVGDPRQLEDQLQKRTRSRAPIRRGA